MKDGDEDDDIMEKGMDDIEEKGVIKKRVPVETMMNEKQRKNLLCLLILWSCIYGLSTYHKKMDTSNKVNIENETKTEWMDALESLMWHGTQSWWILCMCATCSWYVWETQLRSYEEHQSILYSLLEVSKKPQNKMMYQVCFQHTLDGYLRWSLCWFWYQFITLVLQTYQNEITTTIRLGVSMVPVGISILFVIQSMKPIFLDTYYVRMVQAPFVSVTFMDGFIADICTSMIWPCIHIFTSLSVLFIQPLAGSSTSHLILHTYVLPLCRITPLWWRFAQCLRTSYDTQQRWPQLGNAFKYMMTAHISLYYGIRSNAAEAGGHYVWYLTWIGTTIYQLVWDVQMDWNLVSSSERQLRHKQLYSSSHWYYIILGLNTLLRFGWTWSYLPFPLLQQKQLSRSSFLLSILEIVRRMIWGWIRVEWELLSITENSINDQFRPMMTYSWQQQQQQQNDFSIIMELGLWATAFTTLSIFAAMHE